MKQKIKKSEIFIFFNSNYEKLLEKRNIEKFSRREILKNFVEKEKFLQIF